MATAWEVVAGRATNPAALTALTANTGDGSFAIKNFDLAQQAFIEGVWAQSATARVVRLRSSKLHDQVQAIRFRTIAATIRNFFADGLRQRIFPNDVLTFEIQGGGAETDSAAYLAYYGDLPGPTSRFATWDQIKDSIVAILVQEVAVANPTVAGDWSAGTALNATFDTMIANQDYALLGYQTDTNVLCVGLRGIDTANLRVGGPGPVESIETRDWFVGLSEATGKPHIPIINQANRAATLAFVSQNGTGGTTNVGFVLAQLAPGAVRLG